MSMLCYVLGLSPDQISTLRGTPSLTTAIAMGGGQQDDRIAEAVRAKYLAMKDKIPPNQREAVEARFQASMKRLSEAKGSGSRGPTGIERLGHTEQTLGLEKAWHILHYLFTGRIDPADTPADALMTGSPLGADLGYGPARLQDPEATREFASFLGAQDLPALQERLSYSEMLEAGVYALPMGSGSESELRDEVALYFPRLRDYVVDMSAKNNGLLLWIS